MYGLCQLTSRAIHFMVSDCYIIFSCDCCGWPYRTFKIIIFFHSSVVISHQGRYVFLCRHVHASIHNPILQVMNLLAKNTHNSFGTEVFLLPALGCGTPYHHICGGIWTAVAVARIWNSLPSSLRSADLSTKRFKWALKNFLFVWDLGATVTFCLRRAGYEFSDIHTYIQTFQACTERTCV